MTQSDQPHALRVGVDGSVTPVGLSFEELKEALGYALLDFVRLSEDAGCYVNDEGLLDGQPLNVVISMASGRALFGDVVVIGADATEDGSNMPIDPSYADFIQAMAERWAWVRKSALRLGQDLQFVPDPNAVPPPTVVNIPKGVDFAEFMKAWSEGRVDDDGNIMEVAEG